MLRGGPHGHKQTHTCVCWGGNCFLLLLLLVLLLVLLLLISSHLILLVLLLVPIIISSPGQLEAEEAARLGLEALHDLREPGVLPQ